MIKKIYIDTSVFGGKFDTEFKAETDRFFDELLNSNIEIVTSPVLIAEIYRAPEFLIEFYESMIRNREELVELTKEAERLAELYVEEKVVGRTSLNDCQHIAIATMSSADVLVSWNFKHIVNLPRIRGYNAINFREGHQMIEIRTPREIFDYGNNG